MGPDDDDLDALWDLELEVQREARAAERRTEAPDAPPGYTLFRLASVQQEVDLATEEVHRLARVALGQGATYSQVGEKLRLSKAAVAKRYGSQTADGA